MVLMSVSDGKLLFDVAYVWQKPARSMNERVKVVVGFVKAVDMMKCRCGLVLGSSWGDEGSRKG